MSDFDPDKLLEEFKKTLPGNGRRKAGLAESVSAIWEYLVKTPGEQRPYDEFGKMLGVKTTSASFGKLKTLTRNGVIRRTSPRRAGNGVGFVCEWLEARRRGESFTEVAGAERDARKELTAIDALAEKGVQSMRMVMGEDSKLGGAMVEMLREIQTRTNRALIGLADKR